MVKPRVVKRSKKNTIDIDRWYEFIRILRCHVWIPEGKPHISQLKRMFLASASHWPYNKMVIKRSAKHLPQGPGPGMENVQEPSALGIPNQEISQTYPPLGSCMVFTCFYPSDHLVQHMGSSSPTVWFTLISLIPINVSEQILKSYKRILTC